MKDKINVLIFPAEGQNAYELHDALSTCVNIHLMGATSVARHGEFIFENYIKDLPFISASDFLEKFNKVVTDNHIDVIFPTHDSVVQYLINNATHICAKIIGGSKFTSDVCRSKILTYDTFQKYGILPKRFCDVAEIEYPAFSKPDEGQGAVDAKIITCKEEALNIDFTSHLVTEYLPGKEFTVDCFTDKEGKLLYVSPRSRQRTMAGISVRGESEEVTPEIEHIAEVINARLSFLGIWYFQIKQDSDGEFKLMEISTRCAGSMCQTRAKGINLPLLSVYTAMGYDISASDNGYHVVMDRALIGRYKLNINYNYVYIDFDDTITTREKINLNTIRFLYQCRNQGKKVILITRHEEDLNTTLGKYAISKSLFYKIIHIHSFETPKSQSILYKDAIFIDNAYKDREDVKNTCHIPVFDVDQVEFLLDWRI
ncbi:ATP-grasp domain-containing protein [Prevotella sp. kh1p2]|uniref:ATP-grasp domain-containing protein n=1 Tax=Prevotella sp. kh1p2 TaxID=1761883 RepID=UPI0008D7D201|nr:ATP-grasp domain-containing protein [Prevotella sp. kh1p2]SET11374.1 hypothetical protein SAMN04487825_11484 [Prevotella sp. kh1p2]SNU11811.1 hypothetical protein SAMN06298210_11421 [Prevotellaceae bacterium KH2P17]